MSTAARIEELRNKFEENPRRYFAPLANELRKAGDLTQAIALCREHLPKQPGHMSGYIVFGQALYESGDLDEGRVVFEQALALDPENLIALHHLGHIAKQRGDTQLARRWYERALETDPRNDDIAHQLAALATPVRPVAAIPTPPMAAPVVAEDVSFLDLGAIPARRDLGAIPTPPFATNAVDAVPLAPTPDAAMRAVDFDVVNETLRNPVVESVADAIGASSEPLPVLEAAAPEPIDLSIDDFDTPPAPSVAMVEPIVEFNDAPVDVSGQVLGEDPFSFDDDAEATVSIVSPEALSEPADLAADFEEGLVTAAWPDTSEFTGRSPTPRSATPAFVDVTPDAVEAFGREPQDPIIAPLPEPEPEVLGEDADLVALPVLSVDELEDVVSNADPREELPWIAAAVTPTEDVTAIVHALEEDARAVGEAEDVAVFALPEPQALVDVVDEAAVEEASFVDVLPAAADEESSEELAEESAEEPAAPAFVTETMGELLVAQGFVDRAVTVYEELVRRRPYDPVLSARLEELREQLAQAAPTTVFTARERYATLAARRVPRRTPPRAATPVATAAMTATMTPAMQTAIPTPIRAGTPIRSATPMRSATPIGVPAQDSLTALFGSESMAQDDTAAQALADAFSATPMDTEAMAPSESFFGTTDTGREATPAYGTPRQSAPVTPVAPVAEQGGEFSFDRFFPDPASTAQQLPPSGEQSAVESAPRAGDDLAQFSAWLKGLGNS